jgi:hypothetical protein
MLFRKSVTVFLLVLLLIGSVYASQQGREAAAVKTEQGALLVWNQPDNNFTLDIIGKEVLPNDTSDEIFFKVDGMILQVQAAAISEFYREPDKAGQTTQSILIAHRDWESQYAGGIFKKKVSVQSSPLKLKNGSEALFWTFAMPDGFNDEAKKQLFVTAVNGKHVIVLNGVVTNQVKEEAVQQLLVRTMETFKANSKPLDLQKLQDAVRPKDAP